MRLRALIVDDEPVARHRLKRLLNKHPDVAVIAECEDGQGAVTAIQKNELDVVFLDVQMPAMSGFDVVRAVGPERMPSVIFVTAFDAFALQAFEAQALDYLLKPFGEERVARALNRARTFLEGDSRQRFRKQLSALLSTSPASSSARCLMVKDKGRMLILRPNEIDWVEADGDYVRLHVGQEGYFIRTTITNMEERLAPTGFVRIHRSRLVNIDRIKEIHPFFQGESVVVLKTGLRLGASQGGLKQLQDRFSNTF